MIPKPLLQLVLAILVAGVLLWGLKQFPAIDPTLKQIAWVVIIVCVALYALFVIGRMLGVSVG